MNLRSKMLIGVFGCLFILLPIVYFVVADRWVLNILLIAILVTGLVLTVFLRVEILNPLSQMNKSLDAIRDHKDPSKRVPEGRTDEIGELAHHINSVLAALEEEHAKYIQAQKMEAVGILAGGMAHDFNNILGGIMGYASLLKQKLGGDEKVLKQLNVIISSAERGAQITRELLGFARRGKYEKKAVDMNASIQSAVAMLDATIGKDVEIKLSLLPDLQPLEGDSNQIFQVLLNLSVNARDAMPDGGHIHIRTDNVALPTSNKELGLVKGDYVRVIFSDTGKGIPGNVKDKIFEPFFTTKPSNKGTGLGLSMIYGIMQNHGGNIVLANTSVEGSEFHLYFPASVKKASMIQAPSEMQLGEVSFVTRITNKKILLADDEIALRDVLKETLEAAGNQVFCAENGREAVALFRKHKDEIDVIILDLIMPEMDGVAAYKVIRQFLTRKIPVIFSSGYTASSQIAAIRKTDGVMFIQKPFCPDEIFNLLALNLIPPV